MVIGNHIGLPFGKHKGVPKPPITEVIWNPNVTSNVSPTNTQFFNSDGSVLENGTVVSVGAKVYVKVTFEEGADVELHGVSINGTPLVLESTPKGDMYAWTVDTLSPQQVVIDASEFIRYEDIVQPYPAIINLKQDGKTITWGDKLKVGSEVTFVNHTNLLPDLYTISGGVQCNGTSISWDTPIVVEKSMTFTNAPTYLKANEPNCILAPQILRIPNSSYKILGHIPDLTGKGNHGVFNNFAFTEESGVSEDGSIQFDGVDDFITIPTLSHGAKQVLMKVRSFKPVCAIYDQRTPTGIDGGWIPTFCIFMNNQSIAYVDGNNGNTYIDGILNTSIQGNQLVDITHNITVTNENTKFGNTQSPLIGKLATSNTPYAQMALFAFMSFDNISSEEEIKELNDIVGIEGGYVESPNYYWDAYGKKNTDADRNLIADQVSKDVANALEVKNVAYNSESGYTDDNGLLLDGVEDHAVNTVIPAVTDFTVIGKRNILNYESGFAIKGGNTTSTAAFVLEYGSDKFYNFGGVNTVEYPNTITVATKSSYNNNPAVSSQGIDSLGLRIGEYRNYYSKLVFYKLMLYTKTIDQLSINMLKNLFERDELIDVTNPIFKNEETD